MLIISILQVKSQFINDNVMVLTECFKSSLLNFWNHHLINDMVRIYVSIFIYDIK